MKHLAQIFELRSTKKKVEKEIVKTFGELKKGDNIYYYHYSNKHFYFSTVTNVKDESANFSYGSSSEFPNNNKDSEIEVNLKIYMDEDGAINTVYTPKNATWFKHSVFAIATTKMELDKIVDKKMKQLSQQIQEALLGGKNLKHTNHNFKYYPKTTAELKKIINDEIKIQGNNADLNCIDTSEITDMTKLFEFTDFNGDISRWNVSNVKNMTGMFDFSKFNGDISKWNIRRVENMTRMFWYSNFDNTSICKWNVNDVLYMKEMFAGSSFKRNLSGWDVSNADHTDMLKDCPLEKKKNFWPQGLDE